MPGFAQHVCRIAFRERGLQLLLAGRIDAFADDDRVVKRNLHYPGAGGNHAACAAVSTRRPYRAVVSAMRSQQFVYGGDMGRRRSATAADDGRARLYERGDVSRELLRADGEHGAPVDDTRHSRVRLHGDR